MPFFESSLANFHYYEYGEGSKVMLAFHGFGMRGDQFKVLEEALGKSYKIYSFDLFFHGNTNLFDSSKKAVKKSIDTRMFTRDVLLFIESLSIENQKISLLSYSIGAKLALSLIQEIPDKISETFLIAPDGIEPNMLLEKGANNKIINYFFWHLVYSPKIVMFLLKSLVKFRYIDDSLHYILKKEFLTTETRLTCYNTITYFAGLKLDMQEIVANMNSYHISCYLYFGKKDGLFPPVIGKRFSSKLKKVKLYIVDEGHDLVNSELNYQIKEHLKVSVHD